MTTFLIYVVAALWIISFIAMFVFLCLLSITIYNTFHYRNGYYTVDYKSEVNVIITALVVAIVSFSISMMIVYLHDGVIVYT